VSKLLEVRNLVKYFPVRRGLFGRVTGYVKAVDGVSFSIGENEVLALVGESGSGKTTTARCILRLIEPTSGEILFMGRDVTRLRGRELKWYRRNVQAVFQNPFLSLNPRMRVRDLVAEPLRAHGEHSRDAESIVEEHLEMVGLPREVGIGSPRS
jgi:ABC-type oligopeptide transport system ATPase subunit